MLSIIIYIYRINCIHEKGSINGFYVRVGETQGTLVNERRKGMKKKGLMVVLAMLLVLALLVSCGPKVKGDMNAAIGF